MWVNAPDHLDSLLGSLPAGAEVADESSEEFDYVHVFATEREELEEWIPRFRTQIKQDGMIWASWPKQSSPLAGELKESVVRQIGLDNNLVDVKVAAIDRDWSGLKFVIRVQDRVHEG